MHNSSPKHLIPRLLLSRWRFSDWTFGLLAVLAVLAVWQGFLINDYQKVGRVRPVPVVLDAWERFATNDRPETWGCGGDFLQFYIAGTIINRGEAARLYDQPYFRHFQRSMRNDPLCSLYPPTMALLVAPLARLAYHQALVAWWMIQAACIVASGAIFYRQAPLSRAWKVNMLMALAGLLPLWIAVAIGHLAPILLLVLGGGLSLHKQGKHGWAGLVLSILALKPQLAVGLVLWMFLRRNVRTLLGLAAGFALQVLAVAVLLGPGLWLDYLHAMPGIAAVTRAYYYSPMFEQSFAGTASNLLRAADLLAWQVPVMRITHTVMVGAAAVMLCHIAWPRRPVGWDQIAQRAQAHRNELSSRSWWACARYAIWSHPTIARAPTLQFPGPVPASENYEYACGVLFMTIFPPYFLLYDQTLLAVALVMLWTSPAWRWGVVLFAATTVLLADLSLVLGFSLTGLVALATMASLSLRCRSYRPEIAT